MAVPITRFGKDHWSTFAYVETCAVDHEGQLEPRRMRCDENRHPQFVHIRGGTPPTRLKGDEVLSDHDDWDCLDDCEIAGLVKNVGTGLIRVYQLTPLGQKIASDLRIHKQKGGTFSTFVA
jgi:hypothetical protein